MSSDNPFGEVIFSYSRQQAIEDGVLVEVGELAREAGFKFPTVVTQALEATLRDIPEGSGQDYTGRLWDVLFLAHVTARQAPATDRVGFEVIISTPGDAGSLHKLLLHIGPGDTPEPVLTIGYPSDF
jgi:hypothetical protein